MKRISKKSSEIYLVFGIVLFALFSVVLFPSGLLAADSCNSSLPDESISGPETVNWYSNKDALNVCRENDTCLSTVCPDCAELVIPGDDKVAFDDYLSYKQELAGVTIDQNMDYLAVKNIQEELNNSCNSSLSIDCKLGKGTLGAVYSCNICPSPSVEKIILESTIGEYNGIGCKSSDGLVEDPDNSLCCIVEEFEDLEEIEEVIDCIAPLFEKNGECVVKEVSCKPNTIVVDECSVEIVPDPAKPADKEVIKNVTIVDPSSGGGDIDCSKSATKKLVPGQSCCDGYKKESIGKDSFCKECGTPGVCCGIELNTVVPFIGDCIQFKTASSNPNTTVVGPTTAFPKLMQGLSKLMVTGILVFSFVLLIVAGVMMAAGGANESSYNKGKQLIGKVIVGIALLGAVGVILKLINPNFFG